MRVAINVSGHLRSFRQTVAGFRRTFRHLCPDVFCHTWQEPGAFRVTEATRAEVTAAYGAKRLVVDDQTDYPNPPQFGSVGGFIRVKNQFQGIMRADALRLEYERQTGTRYDVVIRTRFDIDYKTSLPQSEIERAAAGALFLVSTPVSQRLNTYSETIYFSDAETMRRMR